MDSLSIVLEPARAFAARLAASLPGLLLAAAILVAGWLLARLARYLTVRALRAINFGVLTERAGIDGFLRGGGVRTGTVELLGALAYWLLIVLAVMAAFDGLGISAASALLGEVALFVPRVFVAVVVLAIGIYFANFAGAAAAAYFANIGVNGAARLGVLVRVLVVVFVTVLALDQLAIGGALLRHALLVLLAGGGLAFALAFGIGGRDWAAGVIERWRARTARPGGKDES